MYGGSLYFSDSTPFIMKTLLIKFRIARLYSDLKSDCSVSDYYGTRYHEMDQASDICMFPSNLDLFVPITNSQKQKRDDQCLPLL